MKREIFCSQNRNRGFSLVETMVSIAIFVILAAAAYQVAFVTFKGTQQNREGTSIAALADQYLEIARNLPYSSVGTLSGVPHGVLADEATNPGTGAPDWITTTYNGGTYKIFYEVTYIDDAADGKCLPGACADAAAADYKQVKLSITNTTTSKTYYFLTNIVPKGLESLSSGGALYVSVGDATGHAVAGATISISSVGISPAIVLPDRTTDSAGHWIEVGLPAGANAYHISVTKDADPIAYSTDYTTPITVANPNPTKPDATIVNGTITSVSFFIDHVSTLSFQTQNTSCTTLPSIGLSMRGTKLIGGTATASPVYKYDNSSITTDVSGNVTLPNMEWDTTGGYTPAVNGTTYMVYGTSPAQPINLGPNTSQLFKLILGPWTSNSFLVTVKDSTGNAIEGATVTLSKSGYTATSYTGGSLWSQSNWSGGSAQASWSDPTKYFSSTSIDNTGMRLQNSGSPSYVVTSHPGNLISSTFDTGAATTNYTTLSWQPTTQPTGASTKFQIATNNDNATWNFVGPDGTSGTYFTTSGASIAAVNDGKQYVRFKAILDTSNNSHNPLITSVTVNYVSGVGCFTPAQVIFTGLTTATTYTLNVSMTGYTSKTITPLTINGGYNAIFVTL